MAYIKADNTMLAVGMVVAAMIVILVRPANINLSQVSSQSQTPSSGSNPLGSILGFLGL